MYNDKLRVWVEINVRVDGDFGAEENVIDHIIPYCIAPVGEVLSASDRNIKLLAAEVTRWEWNPKSVSARGKR